MVEPRNVNNKSPATFGRRAPALSGTRNHYAQRGSALIVGMIFLLVMTMLGVTAMQTTTLEERMAGNMRDRGIAMQAAELALRAGDADAVEAPAAGAGLFDYLQTPAPDESNAATWITANDRAWSAGLKKTSSNTDPYAAFPGVASDPEYWIERRPNRTEGGSLEGGIAPPVQVFDITARSTGATGNTTVVLRSTVID